MNYISYRDVVFLPDSRFNFIAEQYSFKNGEQNAENAVIIHYSATNPWRLGRKNELYQLWWDAAQHTPFYAELLREQLTRAELSAPDFAVAKNWDMAKIYEFYYKLKGTGKVKAWFHARNRFALYGAGKMAEDFWEFLEAEGVDHVPIAVMDANLAGKMFRDVPICNDTDWADTDCHCDLIVTPAGLARDLVDGLKERVPANVRVLTLRDFLNEIS